jgi:hypothetical protein
MAILGLCRRPRPNMHKRKRKHRSARRYSDVEIALPLVQFLNRSPDSSLRALVHDVKSYEQLWKSEWTRGKEIEVLILAESIDLRMQNRPSYRPGFTANHRYPKLHGLRGEPITIEKCLPMHEAYAPTIHPDTSDSADPAIAVAELSLMLAHQSFDRLLANHAMSKLRICDVDGQWFCCKAENHVWCSDRCRQRKERNSPHRKAWRQKNAAYHK